MLFEWWVVVGVGPHVLAGAVLAMDATLMNPPLRPRESLDDLQSSKRETSKHKNGLILFVLPLSHIDGLRVRGECQWPVTTVLFFDTKHSHTAHTQAPTVTLVAPYKRPQPQPLFGIIQRTAAQA